MKVASPDDLHGPTSGGGDRLGHFRPLVSGVGEDTFDEWKAAARLLQQFVRPVAVLNVSRQDAHAEQKAERVDEDVALAARDGVDGAPMAPRVPRWMLSQTHLKGAVHGEV